MAASFPELYKTDVLKAIETIDLEKVGQALGIFIQARDEGRRIFVCGNGGSTSGYWLTKSSYRTALSVFCFIAEYAGLS